MAVNALGIVSIAVFYLFILAIGLFAAWKKKKRAEDYENQSERAMVGERDIGLFVLSFTMTATWVGGGYINGTAEYVYTPGFGLLWTQAPFGYALSLAIAGLLFAKQMRKKGYVTMLDPLQRKLGQRMGGILYLPALCGEIFWCASILAALGGTIAVIIGLDIWISVIVSAGIAVFYTLIGGLYSVAYTDVVQLFCIFIGLWLSIPFAITNPAVGDLGTTVNGTIPWLGSWDTSLTGTWIDSALLLIFGGIPWQAYFQRVLASNTVSNAQTASFIAALGCAFMAIPSILIGATAAVTDWDQTGYKTPSPVDRNEESLILPIVLQYLTPKAVAFIGLGAVSAAVMSSADSSLLSASSMFTRNIYKMVLRQKASEKELAWVLRITIFVMGVISCVLALTIDSVYALWYLSSDFVYVLLFPQLLCVIYFDPNTYGSICAFVLGLILRLGGGEPTFGMEPFIYYPGGANFPYKTFAMLVTMATLMLVSRAARYVFTIAPQYDFLHCNHSFEEKDESSVSDPKDNLHGIENASFYKSDVQDDN